MKPRFIFGNKILQMVLLFHKKQTMTNKIRLMSAVTLFSLLVSMFFGVGSLQSIPQVHALNNGLVATPPMGWNSWNKFGCNVTDALVRQMADAMVSSGMAAAGYKYVNIDDCWQNVARTNGHVTATSSFPNGIKAVADYVHSKGLKLGIYSDRGDLTCAGRAGSYGFETTDANDYAAWGVDYLKYDNCNAHAGSNQQQDYERMRNALAASGRPIVFSICAWTYVNWMPATGNLWRTTGDISDNWNSMWGIPNGNNASASVAGPGAWSDPDMLEVGNGGMTDTEYRTHFGWWAVMAAPLIAGNDLRSMSQATRDILMAPEIIAVDQDSLGVQGTRVWDDGNNLNIWSKRINGTNARAIFLVNGRTTAASITVNWSQIGLPAGNATVRDLWSRQDLGTFNNSFTASNIPAHGSRMLKIVSTSSGGADKVVITKTDTRAFDNFKITTTFTVENAVHYDWESHGTFNQTINDGLNGNGGTWNASAGRWEGSFLFLQSALAGSQVLTINKVDTRPITNFKIEVEFTIGGVAHYDFQIINSFTGTINLVLNANGGTLNSSSNRWEGDFLHP